ncbi:hypothetical protein BO94DRAFT_470214 [Aspergillus sclerotioniger CBS 115572]|uniref:Integral membrane protein n=1 Tax=Aspergillus sclerotioniger CBS 115572 TaxID=1450535 RepID=A0A317W5G0_9EURO|nr:hypothetical protein BO94DRAFT_470214 [Aspergillus sclerotioniger CBS 115572]PWY81583.1 hypothetical protein BO94DRAFT_470214 [Aspergillus sclerotioniger CBS 115572]
MRHTSYLAVLATILAPASLSSALPHGDDDMHMGDGMSHGYQSSGDDSPMSYFAYGKHTGTIVAHIALMILGWCFILPIGIMLSVARSRFALPSQFLFLIINSFGMLLGIIYNNQTPDLYPNNAHHKIGWIASSVACAQVVMLLIFTYAGRGNADVAASERAAFIPVATEETAHQPHSYPFHNYSRHSIQGAERDSSIHSGPSSSTCVWSTDYVDFEKPEDDLHDEKTAGSCSWLRNTFVDRFLASRVPGMVSSRVLRVIHVGYMVIDRIILPFGFIAIATGGVTYGGIMRGIEIFNGLAHFIKGGIFFWYGLLTLGRWMGCWSDLGWSWNVKPPAKIVGKAKARVPSAEFVESLVIFLYGVTNVFLEHLSGWGGAWTARDLEHVSISILFFGGGLCGMLFESNRVRNWINTTVLQYPARGHVNPAWNIPTSQTVSLNPMPALVILLLGTMMASHHQDSMISSMVHQQWGNLLSGFAIARILTYVILFLKPPTSYLPSRPPTEVLASFCLVGGGLIFMMSTRDIVETMIYYKTEAMFVMTVGMGLTAFVMAWEVLVIAIKAWATRREMAMGL